MKKYLYIKIKYQHIMKTYQFKMLKYNVKLPAIASPVEWSGVNFPRSVSVFRGTSEASRETITVGTRIKNLMVLVVPHRTCV